MLKNGLNYLLLLLFFFHAQSMAASIIETERFQQFIQEIRCVVCQNQSLADSNAPLASDLRKKIAKLMQENKTDSEIKNYLVARYGEFILLKPRFYTATWCLWLFPIISLITGLIYLQYFIRNNKK